ncbi:MAG: polyketide cyclase / dehydrase and lipid transport [Mycobacterium sp.]
MHSIQIADDTFVAADPILVGESVADRASWRRWFPDLNLDVVEDRADKGMRWAVTGALTGTMEIWLEPVLDGVVLHFFVHAEPSGATAWQLAKMDLATMTHRRRVAGKRMAFEIKNRLEASRPLGTAPGTALGTAPGTAPATAPR